MSSQITDPREIKKQKEKAERDLLRKKNNLKSVLQSKEGREFVWDMLVKSGLFASSVHQSGSWTYYNEGRRSVALDLAKAIETEDYVFMMNEQQGDKNV